MARVAGINIPVNKRVEVALTYIYGIGSSSASSICKIFDINPNRRVSALTEDEIAKIRSYIRDNYIVEGDLKKEVSINIKHKIDIGCYSGIRHRKGLPVRGQRTRTNSRTRKGRVRIPIAAKKK